MSDLQQNVEPQIVEQKSESKKHKKNKHKDAHVEEKRVIKIKKEKHGNKHKDSKKDVEIVQDLSDSDIRSSPDEVMADFLVDARIDDTNKVDDADKAPKSPKKNKHLKIKIKPIQKKDKGTSTTSLYPKHRKAWSKTEIQDLLSMKHDMKACNKKSIEQKFGRKFFNIKFMLKKLTKSESNA